MDMMDAVYQQHIKNCEVCKNFFSKEHMMLLPMGNRKELNETMEQIYKNNVQGRQSRLIDTKPVVEAGSPMNTGSMHSRTIIPTSLQETLHLKDPVQFDLRKRSPGTYVVKKIYAADGSMSYIVNPLPSQEYQAEEERSIINTIQAVENSFLDTSVNSNFVPSANISPVKNVVHPSVYTETNISQTPGVMTSLSSPASVKTQKTKAMTSLLSPTWASTQKRKVMTSDLPPLSVKKQTTKTMTTVLCPVTGKLLQTEDTSHLSNLPSDSVQDGEALDTPMFSGSEADETEIEDSVEYMPCSPGMELEVSHETEVMTSSPDKVFDVSQDVTKVVTSSPYISQDSEVIASLIPLVMENSGKQGLVDNSSMIEVSPLTSVSSTPTTHALVKGEGTPSSMVSTDTSPRHVRRNLRPKEISMQAVCCTYILGQKVSAKRKQELQEDLHHLNAVIRHVIEVLDMTAVKGKVVEEGKKIVKQYIPNINFEDKNISRAITRKFSKHIFYTKKRQRPCYSEIPPPEKPLRYDDIVPAKRTADDGPDEELFKQKNEVCLLHKGYPVGKAWVRSFPYNFHNIEVEDKREWVGVQMTLKKRSSRVDRMPLATDTRIWDQEIGRGAKFVWKTSDVKKVEFYDLYRKHLDSKKRRFRHRNNAAMKRALSEDEALSDGNMSEENDMEEDS